MNLINNDYWVLAVLAGLAGLPGLAVACEPVETGHFVDGLVPVLASRCRRGQERLFFPRPCTPASSVWKWMKVFLTCFWVKAWNGLESESLTPELSSLMGAYAGN